MELSEELKHFTELAAHIQAHYQFASKEKKRIERMITDYLHILELEDLPAQNQLRLAREIKHLRKERRKWQDILDVEEPFAQFLEKKPARDFLAQLAPVLERTAHQENYIRSRSYQHKELTEKQVQAIKSRTGAIAAMRELLWDIQEGRYANDERSH